MASLPLTPVSPGSAPGAVVLDPTPAYFGLAVFGEAFYGNPGRELSLAGALPGTLTLTTKTPGVLP